MQLKQYIEKVNQILFAGNILKLLFSYRGSIGRLPYIVSVLLFFIIERFCFINPLTLIFLIISLMYCWPALIQKRCRSFNSTGTWYIIANFLFLYTLNLVYNLDLSYFPEIKWYVYSVWGIAIIVNLILVLRPIKQEIDEQKRSFLTRFPIIFSILAFIGFLGMFELKDRYIPDTNRPSFHLGLAIGQIYRHIYAYPEFCKAQGYEMVNYPNKVRERLNEEIKIVENDQMALLARASTKDYETIQDFYESDEGFFGTEEERLSVPLEFFETLRRRLIAIEIAEEQQIDVEEVELTQSDDKRVSLRDACKVFDEDADYFVSSDCNFNYILNYAGKYSNCGTYFNTKGQK